MNHKKISEVIDGLEMVGNDGVSMLTAPVGAGKTYYAVKQLSKFGKVLFLTALKSVIDEVNEAYKGENFEAITFAKFESNYVDKSKDGLIPRKSFKSDINKFMFIVVDEAHDLADFSNFMKTTLDVRQLITEHSPQTLLMTATPQMITIVYNWSGKKLKPIEVELHTDAKPKQVVLMEKKSQLLKHALRLSQGEKAMYFVGKIEKAKEVEDALNNERIRAISIVGEGSAEGADLMSDSRRREVLEHLRSQNKLPDDIQVIVSTSVLREGINVKDNSVKFVYTELMDYINLFQIAGRVRHGADVLYGHIDVRRPERELQEQLVWLNAHRQYVDEIANAYEEADECMRHIIYYGVSESMLDEKFNRTEKYKKFARYNPYTDTIEFNEELRVQLLFDYLYKFNLSTKPKHYVSSFMNIEPEDVTFYDYEYERCCVEQLLAVYEGRNKYSGMKVIYKSGDFETLCDLLGMKQVGKQVTRLRELGFNVERGKDTVFDGERCTSPLIFK